MSYNNSKKKRYAIVGTGGRSSLYSDALLGPYRDSGDLVAFCDTNQTRMDYYNRLFGERYGIRPIPTYKADRFADMVAAEKPDVVIVTSIDRTHHLYIIRALELGCDAISEKPMTTDENKCKEIFDAIRKTGKTLRVTFNYRYAPSRTKVKDLIDKDTIGKITSVHFEWLLNTRHGADYFRRWHRDKINSGGLMVHKSTHHFDLVNWWLGASPETVFGFGNMAFYGVENAEGRGVTQFYHRGTGVQNVNDDPFLLDMLQIKELKELYYDAEHEDGYMRDLSVFSSGISIEDTANVLVRYTNGAQMSYSLTAYSPWEGFRVAINGTKGRIELEEVEKPYVNSAGGSSGEGETEARKLVVCPLWDLPYEVELEEGKGSHSGGDVVMLNDIFGIDASKDVFNRSATHIDGARSILTGIAANKSFATGLPVRVSDLFDLNQ